MSDLATMIREYYDAVAEPVGAAEILAGPRPGSKPDRQSQPRRLRPFWVAAAAAIIVVAAISVVALPGLLGGSEFVGDPTSTTILPTTTVPSPTTIPPSTATTTITSTTTTVTPELDRSAMQWALIPDSAPLFESSQVYGLAPWSSGMVAVGSVWTDGRPSAAVWTTSDGRTWSRVADGSEAFGGGAFEMWAAASDGHRLVAVGHGCDDPNNPCGMRPTVWTSNLDGGWERVAHDPEIFGLGGQMTDVVFRDGRIIAVGVYCDDADCHGAAWSSVDGTRWTRTRLESQTHPSALLSGDTLVAVGEGFTGDGRTVAAVWTSPDGVEWTRAPHDDAVFSGDGVEGSDEAVMTSVAASPTGDRSLIAGGWVIGPAGQHPRFWTSSDGTTWQIASDMPPPGIVSDVTTNDDVTVAIGTSIWRSEDGVVWEEVAETASWSNAVAVGTFGWAGVFPSDGVWVSPPPD